MANKRMFSLDIVGSDAFVEMPVSARELYFQLGMYADDEGFIGNPKKIIRMVNASNDDFKILLGKRFILTFESGVVVIKHWLIHNTIRMDRFKETLYQEEKKLLMLKENKAYTEWQPNGNHLEPQVKLSKVNLIKFKEENKNKIPVRNNTIITLKDGTKAKLYFGTWVDAAKTHIKLDTAYYKELNQYEII